MHRAALAIWAAGLAAAVAGYLWMHALGDEARRGAGACAEPATGRLPSCTALETITADETYATGIALISTALAWLCLPVAAWAGAALTGRELESGTIRLAWTQSTGPVRWLAVQLAVPAALLTTGAAGLVLLNRWARGDGDPDLVGDWYNADVFISTGPAALAYPLAGLALGALAGLYLGRTLPAAGTALAAILLLSTLLDHTRELLWPAVTRSAPERFELPRSAFQLSWDTTTATDGSPTVTATFHPGSHFWPLHLMETGIVLAVAVLAVTAAFALVRRRTA
ncbi:hypothetical protein N4P33_33695 [Streptomyces sp. 15-116A]|nr:hypothetical protein [Streptomyces sp. 15-116A]